jgi:hypothetical protein
MKDGPEAAAMLNASRGLALPANTSSAARLHIACQVSSATAACSVARYSRSIGRPGVAYPLAGEVRWGTSNLVHGILTKCRRIAPESADANR